ncbi:enolase C-terminal domain-like protein [Chondromyces apiculatus]|uniref:O-succinylbenzoate synthase n=1 Tax=Chondromyces apiculatus DSM 436 TaxID=1192034 RepID=A0A017TFA9_9BACT|nr:enolase C-terminal domain-like protein [Chondromyces apiculatus]EYF07572.1 O-succinylbenzoate synthase [Chondromyces apiculatus DSM 436]
MGGETYERARGLRVASAAVDEAVLDAARGRRGFVVSLGDGAGRTGIGEAAPLPGFSREDAESCARALGMAVEALRGAGELGETAAPGSEGAGLSQGTAGSVVAVVRGALVPVAAVLDGVPSARFALETALLDLLGQRVGLSIAACLGGARPYAEVPVNGLAVAADGAAALVKTAQALVGRGVRCLKVKMRGRDEAAFAAEVEALAVLRREVEVPEGLELRLDANGAWTEDEARRRLSPGSPLGPLGVRFVEQPVAPELLDRLGPCAVPWAADESLGLEGMAERVCVAGGCAAFVLKPAALGLLRAHALGVMAQEKGIAVVVTHFMDGPIGLAAACELALGLPRAPLACGLDAHAGLAAWPAREVPQRRGEAVVAGTGRAGLGMAPWTG